MIWQDQVEHLRRVLAEVLDEEIDHQEEQERRDHDDAGIREVGLDVCPPTSEQKHRDHHDGEDLHHHPHHPPQDLKVTHTDTSPAKRVDESHNF